MSSRPVGGSSGEIAGSLVRIGGLIVLALGVFEIVKGLLLLAIVQAVGGFLSGAWLLSSVFPELSWFLSLLPVSGTALAVVHLAVGAVFTAVGCLLARLSLPVPPEKRDRWTAALAILAAVAIILGSYGILLALGLSLAGLLLATAELPRRSA